ncbi:PhoD-like phosphatase N-terminal domain-containing protein, partial [Escherichia coli]|uniref:PhoD-like phosphatase N-terminal domain-containing protein n=1 Tax=Escherichia coli TaxID=562 RepID=UPI002118BF88
EHGFASGDPTADGVILWTRATPDVPARFTVNWQIASDPELREIVASGAARTDEIRDYTVKIDVRGLLAGRSYWYRFSAGDAQSAIGRTRTAP